MLLIAQQNIKYSYVLNNVKMEIPRSYENVGKGEWLGHDKQGQFERVYDIKISFIHPCCYAEGYICL